LTSHKQARREATSAIERGDTNAALTSYQLAAEAKDAGPDLWAEYAFLLWRLYEYKRGAEQFRRLLEHPNTPISTLKGIAKCYFQTGQFDLAAEAIRVAVARSGSSDSQLLELLAGALERDNQIAAAREQAMRSHALDPSSGRAVRLLAHLDKRQGNYVDAVDRLRTQLKLHPGDFDWGLRYELAASLDRLGEYTAAWQQLVLAKAQLQDQAAPHLARSYQLRARQAAVLRQVTDADLQRWHNCVLDDSPQRLTFMAGFPRSGTTLLEQILAAHPKCVGTDETGILSTQFIQPIVEKATDPFDAVLELRSLTEDQIKVGRSIYRNLTKAFIRQPIDGSLLIEKDPMLTPNLLLPLRLFPQASIIQPLRDPRDVVVSYFFTMVPLNWSSAPACDIAESAKFYNACMSHWLVLRDRLPWPSIETRYEDMVSDSVRETKRLAEFLQLNWDESMLDVGRRSQQKAIRTPTYDDIAKPIYSRAVGRWHNYSRQLEPVLSLLQPFVDSFGYD